MGIVTSFIKSGVISCMAQASFISSYIPLTSFTNGSRALVS